jgi:hypothetical protein
MPDRTIELVLPKRRVIVRARLLEREAPTVCQLIWERLPLELPVTHAWYSGCEVYSVFPWSGTEPCQENSTICTDAGDLFFYYSRWFGHNAEPHGEIAVYYDRDAVPMGSSAPMAGSLFATIDTAADRIQLAAACEEIWTEGSETLVIRRAEDAQ